MAHAPIGFSALILGPHLEISDLTREALRGEGYLSREGQGPASLSAGGDFPQLWCGRLQLTDTLVVSSPSLAPWEGVIFPSGPDAERTEPQLIIALTNIRLSTVSIRCRGFL